MNLILLNGFLEHISIFLLTLLPALSTLKRDFLWNEIKCCIWSFWWNEYINCVLNENIEKKDKYLGRYDLAKNYIFSLKMYRLYFFTFLKVFWEVCQCVGTPRYLSWMWCLLCRIRNGFGRFSNDFCCIWKSFTKSYKETSPAFFIMTSEKMSSQ